VFSLRKVLILLAPLAALLGTFLAYRYSTAARLDLAITRAEVVNIARSQAAAKGVNTDGWTAMVDLKPDNTLRHYLAKTVTPAEREAIERVLAPLPYRCLLVNPERAEDFVRVTVAPSGRLITYRIPPTARAMATQAQARAAAEEELRRRLGAERAGFEFTGSGVQRHEATSSDVRSFTYRRFYESDLPIEATVETSGANVIGFSIVPTIESAYEDRFTELGPALRVVRGVTIFVLVVGSLIYVIARFVRRLREHEIPLKRTLIVAVFAFLAFFASTFVSSAGQQMDTIERNNFTPPGVQLAITLLMSAIMGTLLGMAWGTCEADLREAYPEKLAAVDALFGGRFSSRAVRSSVATGLVLAAYSVFISGLEPLLRLPQSWAAVAAELAPFQTSYPPFALVLYIVASLPITVALLLTAVSVTHRNGPTRRAKILLIIVVLGFFLFTTVGNHSPIAWGLITATITAAILLVPFFLGDVLAVFVSVAFAFWLAGSAALIAQPSATLRTGGWTLLSGVIVIGTAGAIAGLRKRDEPEVAETDSPEYARNIAERIMLRSEMDAARQAQLRVMPRVVPIVEGTRLAAKHSASAEIGSDYFEFFLSPTHLSVAVADARLPGLSSALCVSMLKGLLLNYAARLTDTRDVADRVYRQLAAIFGDDLPVSFFFGRLDRTTGAFSFATFGTAPRAAIVRGGNAISLEGEEYVELDRSDALVIYTARLADLQDRDGAAIGDDALHRELSATRSDDPQQLVDALFELATRHSRGVEAPQSWAAVAMARSQS
jgi:MFS family permease